MSQLVTRSRSVCHSAGALIALRGVTCAVQLAKVAGYDSAVFGAGLRVLLVFGRKQIPPHSWKKANPFSEESKSHTQLAVWGRTVRSRYSMGVRLQL